MKANKNYTIEVIDSSNTQVKKDISKFMSCIFHEEQLIPESLLPIDHLEHKWWFIKNNDQIIATVAIWKTNNEWHWGRLGVHKNFRKKGIAKQLIEKSLNDSFNSGIEVIKIDARDVTVKAILKIGGDILGERTTFYGLPITPMEIKKHAFLLKRI